MSSPGLTAAHALDDYSFLVATTVPEEMVDLKVLDHFLTTGTEVKPGVMGHIVSYFRSVAHTLRL